MVCWKRKKSKVHLTDAFFMMLTVFQTFSLWKHHAQDFSMNCSTFVKTISKMIAIVEPLLSSMHIKKPNMGKLEEENLTFDNYPYDLYATDVRFQQGNKPFGTLVET